MGKISDQNSFFSVNNRCTECWGQITLNILSYLLFYSKYGLESFSSIFSYKYRIIFLLKWDQFDNSFKGRWFFAFSIKKKTASCHGLKSKSSLQSLLQESKLLTEYLWQQEHKYLINVTEMYSNVKLCSFSADCHEKGKM